MLNVWAMRDRAPKGLCVPAHTVIFPSLSSAMAVCGSIGAWARYPVRKVEWIAFAVIVETSPCEARTSPASPFVKK